MRTTTKPADTTQRINISWELAEQCKAPAAAQGMSVRDYILQTLHRAVYHNLNPATAIKKATKAKATTQAPEWCVIARSIELKALKENPCQP